MADHAKLSPSGAHRWMRCPGSVTAEAGLPDTRSAYADEGTTAHGLAQECLARGIDTNHVSLDDPGYDEDMRLYVQEYVDFVRSLLVPGASLLVEVKVSLEDYVPGGFGTSDAVVILPPDPDGVTVGYVIDLKYGQGVKVDARDNEQAMLYALGVDRDYGFAADVDHWELVIHQPRLDHVSRFEVRADHLRNWGLTQVRPAAEAALLGGPLLPGEKQCRWCKAKAVCPERARQALAVAREEFTAIPEPYIQLLQPWEIAKLLPRLDEIEDWCTAVREHAQTLAFAGVALPGYKIVEGRANRAWADRDGVVQAFAFLGFDQSQIYKPGPLIGIPDAEKLLKKAKLDPAKVLSGLIVKPRGKPCLARETDPRPALNVSDAQSDFTAITESTDD